MYMCDDKLPVILVTLSWSVTMGNVNCLWFQLLLLIDVQVNEQQTTEQLLTSWTITV